MRPESGQQRQRRQRNHERHPRIESIEMLKRQENRDGPNRTTKRSHEPIHHCFERSADTALHHDNGSQNCG